VKDHLLEALRNACRWQGLLVENGGPTAAFGWPLAVRGSEKVSCVSAGEWLQVCSLWDKERFL